jgi:hypothetical protein
MELVEKVRITSTYGTEMIIQIKQENPTSIGRMTTVLSQLVGGSVVSSLWCAPPPISVQLLAEVVCLHTVRETGML